MTDSDAPPSPGALPDHATPDPATPEAATPAAPSPPPPRNPSLGRRLAPVALILCGAVLVAMTVGWMLAQRATDPDGRAEIASLHQQVAADQARVTNLTSAMNALNARVASLTAQTRALTARPPAAADPAALAALAQRVTALEARPAGGDTTALDSQMASLAQKLAGVARASQEATARLARLAAARAALDAGKPLGTIPGAPAPLARFATASPPTEALLRERFPAAEEAALAASRPPTASGVWARLKQRAQSLLTVRVGDRIVAGPPAAATLDAASHHLDAGDLAGAVAALAPLDPAAAKAMAAWTGDASALLAARAALDALAQQSAAGSSAG